MRGTIIGFDPDSNTGAITGEDGGRYDFVRLDWRGAAQPRRGVAVDFVADGMQAKEVYALDARFDPGEGDTAKLVYILYLASLIVGITAIIGVIVAYVNRGDAPDWVQTHYRFQIRTFWIGVLYGLISLITVFILIGFLFALFTLVWWIVRCAKGLQRQSRGEAYDNPTTWLW
jgi:uncharacterized membrane protein